MRTGRVAIIAARIAHRARTRGGSRFRRGRRLHDRLGGRPDFRKGRRGRGRGRRTSLGTLQFEDLVLHAGYNFVVFLGILEKIGDIEKGVAIETDIHKGGLHARQHSRNSTFVNASRQRVFVFSLMIDFDDLLVLHDRHTRLVTAGRNY